MGRASRASLRFRQIVLGSVGYLVFDEADRMLDMGPSASVMKPAAGFEPQIRDIVQLGCGWWVLAWRWMILVGGWELLGPPGAIPLKAFKGGAI
eukprot:Skav205896  [mRNA]  locus=scaffold123:197504:197992:+ [translate_table: standard]